MPEAIHGQEYLTEVRLHTLHLWFPLGAHGKASKHSVTKGWEKLNSEVTSKGMVPMLEKGVGESPLFWEPEEQREVLEGKVRRMWEGRSF